MAQLKSIDAPLVASKSTYKKHITGKTSEDKVKQLFKNKGYKFLKQRFRTPYSEVDLLFRDKNIIIMIEVKSRRNFTYISDRQLKALTNSYYYLLEKHKCEVRAYLALVEGHKIHIIPDFLV